VDWHEYVDDDLESELVGWRRHLHAHPELAFQEYKTTEFIEGLLGEWSVPFERPLETGVIARIVGTKPGPTIAIRCDIDALPITEENQTDYVSTVPGRMHACGHDGHTAIQLGLAKILSGLTDQISGEIRLLFQPAEEVVESGARHFIEAGALAGVDRIVGLHLWSGLDVGKMSIRSGPVMASMDEFAIRIAGSGGHGAFPHQTIDALVIAASLVAELQTVVSRRIDPLEAAVLTVGTFHAGNAFNVISGEAVLTGTTRALSDRVRDLLEECLRTIALRHAEANGATASVNYRRGSPPLVNDESMVEFVRPAAEAAVGRDEVVLEPPVMGGEDFAYYAKAIPAVFAFVGARNATLGADKPHHHPRFAIDESSMPTALKFLLNTVERAATSTQELGGRELLSNNSQ
jgi:amidohydrolase